MNNRKRYLWTISTALYPEHPFDLIVAIAAPAANFVQRHRQRLFPKTPMIFTAVENRRVQYDKLTENDTVVATAIDAMLLLKTSCASSRSQRRLQS